MASFSPSSNAPPVSDPALSPGGLFSSPPAPSQLPPSTFPQDLPPPPFVDPPPAAVVAPSRPPISAAPPPTDSPTPSVGSPLPPSPTPPADSPTPPSPIPQANSPSPPSPIGPITPADSPPPPSPIPPATTPPPPSPITPADSPPPPSRISQADSPPPPPPSPIPPANTPPPSSPKRPIQPPPSSVPPPLRPILSPPPHTPSQRPPTNSSSPPIITNAPPPPLSTNPSLPPVTIASPPPFRQPAPSPSKVSITPSSNGGIGTGGIVGITAVLGIILLTIIITVSWCLFKRKKKIARHNGLYGLSTSMGNLSQSTLLKIQTSAVEIGNLSANGFVYSPHESTSKFTYEDLFEATNGFSPRNLLGSGGFGYVYKGMLADGTEVAVKELKIGGGQGEREFTAEVEIISRIHHRYLVSLVGYCVSEHKRLLVYEYVPNNTLYHHLHVSELVLDWPTRMRVASGAARGIAYLHEDCNPRVIHRDIKSSNILLDKNFEARVSDFGLAKLAADVTHVTTRVMGTFGYMAPEYARSGNLSEKSDVFSFGVVLLELITGRKPVDASQRSGDEGLVEWARPLLSHALETEDFKLLVDPRLGINFVPNEIFRMIEAAAACIRHSATKRPRMGQIVRAFENLETEDLNNGMRVGESEIYNSAQQSAEIKLFQRMAFGSHNYSTDYFTQGSWATNSTDW
ncbi:putative protein kinase RLK-Pelle-PERK-1 family [Helianthus annuus]|nr:putative protein kinase RLK-Pelle-PERK-1 family [Helianthus annuus]